MPRPIVYADFERVDVRIGRIVAAEAFPEPRKPAYRLTIDFSEGLGKKRSSAQITDLYRREELVVTLVLAVFNLPPRPIGPFVSEVLTLGFPDAEGRIVLARPDADVPLGAMMY